MKLSILDQVRPTHGMDASATLACSLELAKLGDELGYERYWIAEHHGSDGAICSCPEILLGRIGAETSGIRIGAGGILLPHYSPLKVAECFRMLDALYPGRVDLGIGRSPGCGVQETHALKRFRNDRPFADDFEEQLSELLSFINGGFPADHEFHKIVVSPGTPGTMPVWLLGSQTPSASLAAKLGLSYAFAQFICPTQMEEAFAGYRHGLRNIGRNQPGKTILAVSVICAESREEVQKLALQVKQSRQTNGSAPIVSAPTAIAPRSSNTKPLYRNWEKGRFVGTPEKVQSEICEAAAVAETDEVMVLTPLIGHEATIRSYRLLAETFGLKRRFHDKYIPQCPGEISKKEPDTVACDSRR